ncbi:MAG TPA: retropepsin-like aspartic protease [Usitatibacteraceae bacterium]|nr:retropepsin-like aspartic protease [Usitatibacteraceae bacterium]
MGRLVGAGAHCSQWALRVGVLLLVGLPLSAEATKVTLVGLFPGKAVVVINGGEPRTLAAGSRTAEGVLLVSTASQSAMFEIDGKKQTLELGNHFAESASASAAATAILVADSGGHHWANGRVNGRSLRFLVDTGATAVSLPAAFARAAGIDYTKGQRGQVQTANGANAAWRITLDSVSVGDITLYQVNAVVVESGLDTALLGMSFLSRTDMKRDAAGMVLTKRF